MSLMSDRPRRRCPLVPARHASEELPDGFRFIRRSPVILGMAFVGLIANFFDKALLA